MGIRDCVRGVLMHNIDPDKVDYTINDAKMDNETYTLRHYGIVGDADLGVVPKTPAQPCSLRVPIYQGRDEAFIMHGTVVIDPDATVIQLKYRNQSNICHFYPSAPADYLTP